MNNQKSIIGQNYGARGLTAFDLEKMTRANLGQRPYKIIKDPYVSDYKCSDIFMPFAPREAVFVDVLDERTGRTYKVVYEPGNLLEYAKSSESKTDKPREKVEFIDRAQQIAEELAGIFSAGGGISDKCGVVFFTISDNGDGKTDSGAAFVGGRGDRICESIAAACSKNSKVLGVVKRGVMEAMLRSVFTGDEKKE